MHLEKKKPISKKKLTFWVIIAILILLLAWFLISIIGNIFNIFADKDSNIFSLFKKDNIQLEGESEGRVNFLLLGMAGGAHQGASLTDTIIVMSLDTKNNKVAFLSIPRDFYIKIPDNGYTKINATWSIGESEADSSSVDAKNQSGADLTKKTISHLIDLPIHYFVKIDFQGFEKIVDKFGGVDINVEDDLYDPYYPTEDYKYQVFQVDAGWHHFDGAMALKYVRSRKTTSDFDRAKRQQQVLVALKDKAEKLSMFDVKKIYDLSKIVGDSMKTDLSVSEIKRMMELGKNIDTNNIANKVLDNSENGVLEDDTINGMYVLKPKLGVDEYSAIQYIAQNIFEIGAIENETATIEIQNGTNQTGVAYRVSTELKNLGYNITATNTYDGTTQKSLIYDNAVGKKPETFKALKNKFSATTIKNLTKTSKADIILIIGEDYLSQ